MERSTELDVQSTSLIKALAAPPVDTYLRMLVRHHLPKSEPQIQMGKGYENSGLTEYPTWQLILDCEEIRRVPILEGPLLFLGPPYLVIAA